MSLTRLSLRMEASAMRTIWCILLLAVSVDVAAYSARAGVSGQAQISGSGFTSEHSNQPNGRTHQ